MDIADTGRLVSGALDPVLVPAGFQAGQHGDGTAGDVQIIFCAGEDEFSRRYPHLPQADQEQHRGRCVDLVVDVWADGTLGRLDLEGSSVGATLRRAGLDAEGDAVDRMRGCPIVESLPVIRSALARLFHHAE